MKHTEKSHSKLKREKYFLPGLIIIILLGILLKWTLLLTLGVILISAIICGLTFAERIKNEFNIQLYALLVLSVAFGSAIVEGEHASYFWIGYSTENSRVAVLMLFGITLIFTNFMTNVSAVAVAFPIGVAIMKHYGLTHLEVFLPLAFATEREFSYPTSYQTHLMVMGAGMSNHTLKMGVPSLIIYSQTFTVGVIIMYNILLLAKTVDKTVES